MVSMSFPSGPDLATAQKNARLAEAAWDRKHDEAMRMQALAVGLRLVEKHEHVFVEGELTEVGFDVAKVYAKWAYREATGREW